MNDDILRTDMAGQISAAIQHQTPPPTPPDFSVSMSNGVLSVRFDHDAPRATLARVQHALDRVQEDFYTAERTIQSLRFNVQLLEADRKEHETLRRQHARQVETITDYRATIDEMVKSANTMQATIDGLRASIDTGAADYWNAPLPTRADDEDQPETSPMHGRFE